MSFIPDTKQTNTESFFSRRLNELNHLSLNFKNMVVIQSATHKHLGMILYIKLDFQEHLKDKTS